MIGISDEYIHVRQATKQGYIECKVGGVADLSFPTSKLRRGRCQGEYGNISPTITTTGGLYVFEEVKEMAELIKKVADAVFQRLRFMFRIRKLTPSECWVLMGMNREDVEKCRAVGIADSQLYKIAGNGLITNEVQFLMERLTKAYNPNFVTTDEKMVEMYGEIK